MFSLPAEFYFKIVIIAVVYSKIYMIRLQQYLYVLDNKVSLLADLCDGFTPSALYIYIYSYDFEFQLSYVCIATPKNCKQIDDQTQVLLS